MSSYIFASLLSLKWFKMLLKYALARLFIQQIILTQCWMDNFVCVCVPFHLFTLHNHFITGSCVPCRWRRCWRWCCCSPCHHFYSFHFLEYIRKNFSNTHQKHSTLTHWLFTEHQQHHRGNKSVELLHTGCCYSSHVLSVLYECALLALCATMYGLIFSICHFYSIKKQKIKTLFNTHFFKISVVLFWLCIW